MKNGHFDPGITLCFTGHRMIRQSLLQQVRERLSEEVAIAYSNGYRTFLCGGARGFDTLAAQEVLRFRESCPDVRLVLALPCADQPDAASFRTRAATEFMCRNSLCIAATMAT